MNVGYGCGGNMDDLRKIECPICQSNIYINKYNTDFVCQNEQCLLHGKLRAFNDKVNEIFELNSGKKKEEDMKNE